MWPSPWMVFLTGLLNDINSHMIKVLNNNCFKFLLFGFSKYNVAMANTGNWIYIYGLLPQPLCLFSFKCCMGFQGNALFQVFLPHFSLVQKQQNLPCLNFKKSLSLGIYSIMESYNTSFKREENRARKKYFIL